MFSNNGHSPRKISTEPVMTAGVAESGEGVELPVEGAAANLDAGSVDTPTVVTSAEPPAMPEHPEERVIRSRRHPLRIVKYTKAFFAWVYEHWPWRPLTAEEKILAEERRKRAEIAELLRSEMDISWRMISGTLTRLGLCYRYRDNEKVPFMSNTSEIKVIRSKSRGTPDALYFKLDVAHLPRMVNVMDLANPELLTNISLSIGRRVRAEYSEGIGFWYIVERAAGLSGVPAHVSWAEMLEAMPRTADGLTIPIGMTTNSRRVYRSFGNMISMLIGGTTGAGKSNFLKVVICTLISRNRPERVRLVLVDLKNGATFGFYRGVPHILPVDGAPEGIVTERTDVEPMLKWFLQEGDRRGKLLQKARCEDIGHYNQKNRGNPLPAIFLIIDEFGDIKLEPKIGKACEEILINIASKFRYVGIHIIIATQTPNRDVISLRIKGVLVAKLGFSCANNAQSMVILDNASASNLGARGRAVLQFDNEQTLQTPYLSTESVEEIVAAVKEGKSIQPAAKHDVTPLEVMTWALDYENGYLAEERIYPKYRSRGITRMEIRAWLLSWEGKEFVVRSSTYRVEKASGMRARRLISTDAVALERRKQDNEDMTTEDGNHA